MRTKIKLVIISKNKVHKRRQKISEKIKLNLANTEQHNQQVVVGQAQVICLLWAKVKIKVLLIWKQDLKYICQSYW